MGRNHLLSTSHRRSTSQRGVSTFATTTAPTYTSGDEQPIPSHGWYRSVHQCVPSSTIGPLGSSAMNIFSTTPSQRQLGRGPARSASRARARVHRSWRPEAVRDGPERRPAACSGRWGYPARHCSGRCSRSSSHSLESALMLGLLTRLAGIRDRVRHVRRDRLCFTSTHGFFVPMGIEFPMMLCASGARAGRARRGTLLDRSCHRSSDAMQPEESRHV